MNNTYCIECMCERPYILKKEKIYKKIRDQEYEFIVENAYCSECGERVHVHGLDDKRVKDIDEQYRHYERLVMLNDIEKLMSLYDIGKGPLALQKLLYFAQAHYMYIYQCPLFEEECLAWEHGPVYRKVYDMFKELKYNVIEDDHYSIIKNYYQLLNDQQKEIIDLVIETYGMFNGKILERITHQQDPYRNASHNQIIDKNEILKYYKTLENQYNINTKDGILHFIYDTIK